MDILINSIGILLIVFIVGWFWLYQPRPLIRSQGAIDVVVENGVYTPARIMAKQGESLKLRFLRKDPSPCAEKVIFDKLNLAVDLPVGEKVEIEITPEQTGEVAFTCQMQMYRGSIIVEA